MSSHFNSMLKASKIFLEYITGEYQTKAREHLDITVEIITMDVIGSFGV